MDLLKFRRFVYKFRDIPVFSGFIAEREGFYTTLPSSVTR